MKKYLTHILLFPLVLFALTPPWEFKLDCSFNSLVWVWTVFTSGFLSFALINFKTNVFLKLLLIWCFVSCFISRAPYMSFTMFWTVVVCTYYYVACTKIEDFEPVKRTIQAIFFFITLLIIMQLFGKDTLLNFGLKTPVILGTIGNKMMLSSFVCILTPFLIHKKLNWLPIAIIAFISGSSGMMLSIVLGAGYFLFRTVRKLRIPIIIVAIVFPLLFAYKTDDIRVFTVAGRGPVWKETAELVVKNPMGYGIATYKILFQYLCSNFVRGQQVGAKWARAHNSWLQIPFEIGVPGFILLLGLIGTIAWRTRDPVKQSGLIVVGVNMAVHFPDRMCQSVLIIIMFLAYCAKQGEYYV